MGSGYWIYSFDKARFDRLFGGGDPDARQAVIDAALWDDDGYFDGSPTLGPGPNRAALLASARGQTVGVLADRLITKGVTYDGLSNGDADTLDRMIRNWRGGEGLEQQLDFRAHSPDHGAFHLVIAPQSRPSVWSRLRGEDATVLPAQRLLPLVRSGRRYNTLDTPTLSIDGHYFIGSPSEAAELVNEIKAALVAAWFNRSETKMVLTYVLEPIEAVAATGRWIFIIFS
jgi:hypothetical protein